MKYHTRYCISLVLNLSNCFEIDVSLGKETFVLSFGINAFHRRELILIKLFMHNYS